MRRQRKRNFKKEGQYVVPPLLDRSAFDVTEAELDALLGDLCVQMGFCIGASAAQALWERKPSTVDEFVDGLFVAEGLGEVRRGKLRSAVKQYVQAFIAARRVP